MKCRLVDLVILELPALMGLWQKYSNGSRKHHCFIKATPEIRHICTGVRNTVIALFQEQQQQQQVSQEQQSSQQQQAMQVSYAVPSSPLQQSSAAVSSSPLTQGVILSDDLMTFSLDSTGQSAANSGLQVLYN